VIKALALGADFVFLGRPLLYAMGAAGYGGLQQMIELIRSQVDISLAQLGCTDINDIDNRYILGGVEAVTGVTT
jgi:L-lactate dehydrogenase (cytochrome)